MGLAKPRNEAFEDEVFTRSVRPSYVHIIVCIVKRPFMLTLMSEEVRGGASSGPQPKHFEIHRLRTSIPWLLLGAGVGKYG